MEYIKKGKNKTIEDDEIIEIKLGLKDERIECFKII